MTRGRSRAFAPDAERRHRIGSVRFLGRYAWAHWRSGWAQRIQRLLLSSALLALLFVATAFVPAVTFKTLAAQTHAGYDIRVNGPLSDEDLRRVDALPSVDSVAPMAVVAAIVRDEGRASSDLLVYLLFRPSEQHLTWFSPALLRDGRALAPSSEGEVVMDAEAARALQADLGDHITFALGLGPSQDLQVSARLVGVYASSDPLDGTLLFGPSARTRALASALALREASATREAAARILYTDFLVSGATGTLERDLRTLFRDRSDVGIESRRSIIAHIEDVNSSVLGTVWPVVLPQVIVLGYLAIVTRDVSIRLRARRRELATIVALGASDVAARNLLATEILVETLVGALAGILAAEWLLENVVRVSIPPSAWFRIAITFLGATFVVLSWVYVQTGWLLRRRPIAQLMDEEIEA